MLVISFCVIYCNLYNLLCLNIKKDGFIKKTRKKLIALKLICI